MINTFIDLYTTDSSPADKKFAQKHVHRFVMYTTLLVIMVINILKTSLDNDPTSQLGLLIGIPVVVVLIIELTFTFVVAQTFMSVKEGNPFKNNFLRGWLVRRYWKHYNRTKYGRSMFGTYKHNGSYTQGASAARSGGTMGEDMMGSVGMAMGLQNAIFGPLNRKIDGSKWKNTVVIIDTFNRYSGKDVINVNGASNLDQKDVYEYQHSDEAYRKGQEEYDQGYNDNL